MGVLDTSWGLDRLDASFKFLGVIFGVLSIDCGVNLKEKFAVPADKFNVLLRIAFGLPFADWGVFADVDLREDFGVLVTVGLVVRIELPLLGGTGLGVRNLSQLWGVCILRSCLVEVKAWWSRLISNLLRLPPLCRLYRSFFTSSVNTLVNL